MYLLANNSRILLGIFTNKDILNLAISVCRKDYPNCKLYYQKIDVDVFDSTLINFFTMHPEKLIEIDGYTNSI